MTGCTGPVTTSNSLHGTQANDEVGGISTANTLFVTALTGNGKYVVASPRWDNSTTVNTGAVTLCDGATGCNGPVTTSNSLHGTVTGGSATTSPTGDEVGSSGIVALSDGDYVVRSANWDNGVSPSHNVGAVTWCSGATGCTGPVTTSNSLYGTTAQDTVGTSAVLALTGNGNYVVGSSAWDNTTTDVGAATWCSGVAGCTGAVTTSNSLHGSRAGDNVGAGLVALSDGDYVVRSVNWDNGTTSNVGAATWCSGSAGCNGPVSTSNSLHGTRANDNVGVSVTALTGNGNFVAVTSGWDNGTTADVGAVTWCEGSASCNGPVSTSNSLYGGAASAQIGNGFAVALPDGDFVVASANWNSAPSTLTGGVTWGEGSTTGPRTFGVISTSNTVPGHSTTVRVADTLLIIDTVRNKVLVTNHWMCSTCDRILVIQLGVSSSTTTPASSTTTNPTGSTSTIGQAVAATTSTTSTSAPLSATVAPTSTTPRNKPSARRTLPATGSTFPFWGLFALVLGAGALIGSRRLR